MNWEVKIISTSLISTLKFHTCPEDFEHFKTQPNYKGTDPVHKKKSVFGRAKSSKNVADSKEKLSLFKNGGNLRGCQVHGFTD